MGITIGLIVAAGASMIAVNQITEHRRLMLETQVQQDLRAAADLLQQDMRRAGFRGEAQFAVWAPARGVGTPLEEPAQVATPNLYATLKRTDDDRTRALEYTYARGTLHESIGGAELSSTEYFGIKWDKTKKTLYLQLGKKDDLPNWQPITDPDTVEIVDFDIQIFNQLIPLGEFCDTPCTAAGCPQQDVRRVEFKIRGRAKHDGAVTRTLTGAERIRADAMTGACP